MPTPQEHAMACAIYGDCIYDVVQEGASDLEKGWKKQTKNWKRVLEKSVKGRFFGFGAPTVDSDWLMYVLFQPSRTWPKGLSLDELEVLELARAATGYHSLHSQGLGKEDVDAMTEEEESTLKALKQFAALFKRKVALPMWKHYNEVSTEIAKRIQPICESTYEERCSLPEAREIFQGDLERGIKVKSLDVSPATYQVLPQFLEWISA